MNKINNEKNIATLSIVRNMTNNCLRRLGMNRTNLRILSNRNVLKTDKPELPLAPSPPINAWHNSTALKLGNGSSFIMWYQQVLKNFHHNCKHV
ncbi:CLUMA_CG006184, isoform A [Clunio marinus]|uniref:CLUMA_CG006184, isoform A n=1 Tax=Clunio marinus TaxID=568069 RepID=A0A1J1HXB3_9DIPT|nr:CLUMA_CG006184, isoform A [Clunio marinus]